MLAHDPTGAANRLSHGWARTTRTQVFPGRLPEPPATLAGALLFTAIIAMRSQAARCTAGRRRGTRRRLPARPALHRVSPLDFDHTEMLIAEAYEAARTFLQSARVDGPGLYGPRGEHLPAWDG
ncbi:MAG: hypothetical protein WCB92_12840 [Mycobacterium sp.]